MLCTSPAVLAGKPPKISPIFPSVPFAPGRRSASPPTLVGFPIPKVSTPWLTAPGAYRAACTKGAIRVLKITPLGGAPKLTALPDATWGLHLADANIALGQLVTVARTPRPQLAAAIFGPGPRARGLG